MKIELSVLTSLPLYHSYLNFHIVRCSLFKKNGKQFSAEGSNDKMCVGPCVLFRVPQLKKLRSCTISFEMSKITLSQRSDICYTTFRNLPLCS